MKPYRLKDPDTGLYYIPSRMVANKFSHRDCKSNLSKKGKVYTTKQELTKGIYDHTKQQPDRFGDLKCPVVRQVTFEIEFFE